MLFLRNHYLQIVEAWKVELKDKRFRFTLLLMPGLFFAYSAITQNVGNYIEMRKGVRLNDKLLSVLPTFDFSTLVFSVLYTSLIALIITHLHKPRIILRVIEMHFLVAVVRQLCILLVALEPPVGIIVLRDIFLENTVYPHSPLTKDLFFSGHVASIWIYFLCATKKYLKIYLAFATLLMSFMILSMRVHYSYDVYGALFFTTIIYFAPGWLKPYYSLTKEARVGK